MDKDEQIEVTVPETDKPKARVWPVVIQLRTPIDFGKTRVEEITMRRGRLADIKGIKLGEVATEHLILIASRMSGQPTAVIERLEDDEAGEVLALARDFFTKCLATGIEPSPS